MSNSVRKKTVCVFSSVPQDQRGDILASRNYEKKSHDARKTNFFSCFVTTKILKTMVIKCGPLWKRQRLLASKVEKPREIL